MTSCLDVGWLPHTRHGVRELDDLRGQHSDVLAEWDRGRQTRESLEGYATNVLAQRTAAV